MTRMVRTAALTHYLDVAERHGLSVDALLARAGLSREVLHDGEQLIPAGAVVQLLEESAAASGNQGFGLCMAESRQLAHFGALSLLLNHQPTLRDALDALMRYRHLLNDTLAILIEHSAPMTIIRLEIVDDRAISCRQSSELAVGVLFRLYAALLGSSWHPLSVNFTHQPPENLCQHLRLFGCAVKFCSEFNGIVCSAADLDIHNPHANPSMAQRAQLCLDTLPVGNPPSLHHEVRKLIYLLLPMGKATLDQVAQAMGVHERTLQRRLRESSKSFNDLVNDARRDLVLRHLETPHQPLGRIADLLGYAVPGSFSRWFHAQFGMSPARWRKMRNAAYVTAAGWTGTA